MSNDKKGPPPYASGLVNCRGPIYNSSMDRRLNAVLIVMLSLLALTAVALYSVVQRKDNDLTLHEEAKYGFGFYHPPEYATESGDGYSGPMGDFHYVKIDRRAVLERLRSYDETSGAGTSPPMLTITINSGGTNDITECGDLSLTGRTLVGGGVQAIACEGVGMDGSKNRLTMFSRDGKKFVVSAHVRTDEESDVVDIITDSFYFRD